MLMLRLVTVLLLNSVVGFLGYLSFVYYPHLPNSTDRLIMVIILAASSLGILILQMGFYSRYTSTIRTKKNLAVVYHPWRLFFLGCTVYMFAFISAYVFCGCSRMDFVGSLVKCFCLLIFIIVFLLGHYMLKPDKITKT